MAVGYALAFLVLAGNATTTCLNLRTIARSDQLVQLTGETIYELERVLAILDDAETEQRGYLLTGDHAYLSAFWEAGPDLTHCFDKLAQLTADEPQQQAKIVALRRVALSRLAELSRVKAMRDRAGLEVAMAATKSGRGKEIMDEVRRQTNELHEEEDQVIDARMAASRDAVRRTAVAFGIASSLALVLLGLSYILARGELASRKRAEEVLRHSFEQERRSRRRLRALSRRLVEAQEAERRRIARELHDEVGQVLTGLKLSLEMADRTAVEGRASRMAAAKTLLNGLIARLRALSLDLRPTMLDDLGLLPALLWQFEQYTAQTGIHVDFEHAGLERRFRPEVETAAYRIAQEALTNVARHAGVTEVRVRLWADAAKLSLRVEDRGAGFDVQAASSGYRSSGLSGMHERTALLHGRLTMISSPGAGTTVAVELPLRRSRHRKRRRAALPPAPAEAAG
jgi:signal transduction histidine kinase